MVKAIEVSRVYEKRVSEKSDWSGRVGMATLTLDVADDGTVTALINGEKLPEASFEYMLNFSLQAFQDAYAGAKSLGDAQANFDKKVRAVIEGTLGSRGGSGVDEETICQRIVARLAYMASTKVATADKEAFATLLKDNPDAANVKLDALFEKNTEKLEDKVVETMAKREQARKDRAAEKAANAKLGGDLDF